MTDFRSFTADEAVEAARAALAGAVGIDAVQSLGNEGRRNLILRARVTRDGTGPLPVIIKATRSASYPGAANAYEAFGFAKEWAAARYLAQVAPARPFTPALLAYDLGQGVLVYEDLGGGLALLVAPLLHGTAVGAERALIAYAEALAALHRATIGCRAGYAAVLREGFPAASIPSPGHRWIEDVARVPHGLLGGEFPEDEAGLILRHLRQPGSWQALVHGDPCPDNVLLDTDGRAMLIDFEFARPGHALLDAAFWRMGFPTCWCAGTVPADVARRVDGAYRAALAGAVPEAGDDDAFSRESATIDMVWMLGNLAWLLEGALAEDGTWGRARNRSRILTYLDRAIQSADEAGTLPRFASLASTWRDGLRRRWPDALPLSAFPAFAGSR